MLKCVEIGRGALVMPLNTHGYAHVARGMYDNPTRPDHESVRNALFGVVIWQFGVNLVAQIKLEVVGENAALVQYPHL